MHLIKITLLVKKRFAELYEIRLYKKHPAVQLVVKQYRINDHKIIVDED